MANHAKHVSEKQNDKQKKKYAPPLENGPLSKQENKKPGKSQKTISRHREFCKKNRTMKHTIILVSLLLWSSYLLAQCCTSSSATPAFAMLGTSEAFRMAHKEPLPLQNIELQGRIINMKSEDGNHATAYFVPASEDSDLFVFVFQEWWGLNDYIKRESDKLAAALPHINILALDLYDGQIATTREEAASLMQQADEQRIRTIIRSAADFAGPEADIATIGWCFGGGWSLQAALMLGDQARACVMYYGMPETDTDILGNLVPDVLFIHAEQDKWINNEVVASFEKAMTAANQPLEVIRYNEDHGFANPSNPRYAQVAADDAFRRSVAFIGQRLPR